MVENISEERIKNYIQQLTERGEDGFYRHLIAIGIKRSIHIKDPQVEILNTSEGFLLLFRKTGDKIYDKFYRLFRRAAHTLYRQFNKKEAKSKQSNRFLHAV